MGKISFVILMRILFVYIIIYLVTSTIVCAMFKNNATKDVEDGYYYMEKFEEHTASRSHSDLYKYYYKQEDDIKYENNEYYQKVNKEDVSYYIRTINGFFEDTPRQEVFDLNENNISENDYCYIDDDEKGKEERFKYCFSFYYYKVDRHILYHVYCDV